MKMTRGVVGVAALLTCLCFERALGETVYETGLTQTGHTYEIVGGFMVSATAAVSNPSPSLLDVDFSLLGAETLVIRFSAPSGQQVRVDTTTAGWDQWQLSFQCFNSGTYYGIGSHDDWSPTVSFINLVGDAPTLNSSEARLTGPGAGANYFSFVGDYVLSAGKSFAFDAVEIRTSVAAGYNVDLSGTPTTAWVRGDAMSFTTAPAPADPGQWVRLEVIPEPGSMCLMVLSAGAFWMFRRLRRGVKR